MNRPDTPPRIEPDALPPGPPQTPPEGATPPPPPPKRRWHVGRWLLAVLLVLVATLTGALAGLWIWSGREGSLAQAIALVQRVPLVGEALAVSDVHGALRRGGRIGSLRWRQDGLDVSAENIAAVWRLDALLQRRVALGRVAIGRLAVVDHRPPQPSTPPGDLGLPLTVDEFPWSLDTFTWGEGDDALTLTGLAGRYGYATGTHRVQLDHLQFGTGTYGGSATLAAAAPHALEARLHGDVTTDVPGGGRSTRLHATLHATGPLTRLAVTADARALAADGDATASQAHVEATVAPWESQPLPQARVSLADFDAAAFWPAAPATRLSGEATITPEGGTGSETWRIAAHVANALPGPWDRGQLPLAGVDAQLQWLGDTAAIDQLVVRVGNGTITAHGRWAQSEAGSVAPWQVEADFAGIDPALVHTAFARSRIGGKAQATQDADGLHFDADLAAAGTAPLAGIRLRDLQARGRWHEGRLELATARLRAADAELRGQGTYDTQAQRGSGSMTLAAPGVGLTADAKDFGETTGNAQGRVDLRDARAFLRWLQTLPGVPRGAAGYAASGSATLQAAARGGWRNPTLDAALRIPDLSLAEGRAPGSSATLANVTDASATLRGRLSDATLQLHAGTTLGERALQVDLAARGGHATAAWQVRLETLRADLTEPAPAGGTRRWQLASDAPFTARWDERRGELHVGAGTLTFTAPVARASTAHVAWGDTTWQPGRLSTSGRIEGIPLAWLDLFGSTRIADMQLQGDLVLDGRWRADVGARLDVEAELARRSGDLLLAADASPLSGSAPPLAAGLRDARVTITSAGDALRARVVWDSERAGIVRGDLSTRLTARDGGWTLVGDAPLSGQIDAQLPSIGVWSALAPLGWRIGGSVRLDTHVAGTLQHPSLQGRLDADDLLLRSVVDGIEFGQGRLRSTFDGDRLRIAEFVLHGAGNDGGTLSATGTFDWSGDQPRADIAVTAAKLRASVRSDRRVVVSGNARVALADRRLALTGDLTADEALIILPDESTPTLGDDVVVVNRRRRRAAAAQEAAESGDAAATSAAGIVPSVNLRLDLGRDFRVQGHGVQTGLRGQLQLTAQGSEAPRLTGEIQTFRGRYRAYGQNLDIETGIIRFAGPYDNPSLDILAIRPNLTERVGVKIDGTALAPRVQLYSASGLTASETLSWLVLGRSGANGGAEAALLQQAAMALLSGSGPGITGQIAQAFGLDDISLGSSSSSSTDSDDDTAGGAAITVSKRFARNFYVSYERSLTGTLGTLYVFYELSRRLTLRAQSGETTAVDLIYTFSFDGRRGR